MELRKKVLAVPVRSVPKKAPAFSAHDVSRMRLAKAMAREYVLRLEAAQCALRDASVNRSASALDRAARDVDSARDAMEEIAQHLTLALISA